MPVAAMSLGHECACACAGPGRRQSRPPAALAGQVRSDEASGDGDCSPMTIVAIVVRRLICGLGAWQRLRRAPRVEAGACDTISKTNRDCIQYFGMQNSLNFLF